MLHYQLMGDWAKAQTQTERGASLVEYALLVALIAVVCITAVSTLGGSINDTFEEIDQELTTTAP